MKQKSTKNSYQTQDTERFRKAGTYEQLPTTPKKQLQYMGKEQDLDPTTPQEHNHGSYKKQLDHQNFKYKMLLK
jgi:hypothetical protein